MVGFRQAALERRPLALTVLWLVSGWELKSRLFVLIICFCFLLGVRRRCADALCAQGDTVVWSFLGKSVRARCEEVDYSYPILPNSHVCQSIFFVVTDDLGGEGKDLLFKFSLRAGIVQYHVGAGGLFGGAYLGGHPLFDFVRTKP